MITDGKYILNQRGEPVAERELLVWAKWFESANRRVGSTSIGDYTVSTVFLGMDHNFRSVGPPVLWETAVFCRGHVHEMERCAGTREQAEAMHASWVQTVKNTPTILPGGARSDAT